VTLNNFEIYYLSSVNYDLTFIRVNIYLGPGEGGLQLISNHFMLSGYYLHSGLAPQYK
jgi:hypothetical protein